MERDAEIPVDDDEDDVDDVDPRRLRSRTRLLDAATKLLNTGGIEAVTIDAVTKASKVARTTLYRHFSSSTQLLAATFERLLPQVTPPPATGSLRDQLIELLSRQATLFHDAPLHVTTLAWVALGPTPDGTDQTYDRNALRTRIIDHYRQPFNSLLEGPEARADLDDFDLELILCQLVGPVAFARLTGLRAIDRRDCERIVDDFLAAHRRPADRRPSRRSVRKTSSGTRDSS
ncbi:MULTISPECIES: TetR/AcrR family transcriptional regulator [Mycobacterium]|uniref:TetR family transcriptional regulator n=1 Tax=Mycobacterium colombiense TaxID=339268 RepID=A0A329MAM6_9MYCO|nr:MULTISPECIES: TetR/AcrR family transcriptional regulator [Mycobacterium]MDM4139945.1 TetR/AcrR family transcriptional regulator [Mycobacterium sp. FLAC0960]RAV16954.1 TetR family transcriptional regulator [Mycobacterium colombiense]